MTFIPHELVAACAARIEQSSNADQLGTLTLLYVELGLSLPAAFLAAQADLWHLL
jgi:hypothetical protein